MKKVFLSDMDSWNKVLEEESSRWVHDIVLFCGLNKEKVFGKDTGIAVQYLVQNKTFIDYNIKDRSIRISKDGSVIGEWKVPFIKTKIEDGNPFIEITVDAWSVKDK